MSLWFLMKASLSIHAIASHWVKSHTKIRVVSGCSCGSSLSGLVVRRSRSLGQRRSDAYLLSSLGPRNQWAACGMKADGAVPGKWHTASPPCGCDSLSGPCATPNCRNCFGIWATINLEAELTLAGANPIRVISSKGTRFNNLFN